MRICKGIYWEKPLCNEDLIVFCETQDWFITNKCTVEFWCGQPSGIYQTIHALGPPNPHRKPKTIN